MDLGGLGYGLMSDLVNTIMNLPFPQKREISLSANNCLFLYQWVNKATSSPADDVHHYAILQKLLDSIFSKLPVFMCQWEKEMAVLSPVEVLSP
jgi:hypothetical protein